MEYCKDTSGEVWVFIEQHKGEISEASLELISGGRELADKLKVTLTALVPGDSVKDLGKPLIEYGADKVYLSEHPLLKDYQTQSYAKVIVDAIIEHCPQIMLFGATGLGRDLAPRVASELQAGLTADCTSLDIGDYKVERDGESFEYKNLFYQIRPAFGGNIIATIINFDGWPQMATVRDGVLRMPKQDKKRKGEITKLSVNLDNTYLPLKIIEKIQIERRVDLKASRIIVAGGIGMGSKENFKMLYDLADCLGGAVGTTRPVVDAGFIHKDHQIGQTGVTVRPALYIACGISGAVQHTVGMEEAKKIIAINSDPTAPIFKIAHYAIVGDVNTVIPKMIKAIKNRV